MSFTVRRERNKWVVVADGWEHPIAGKGPINGHRHTTSGQAAKQCRLLNVFKEADDGNDQP